jgi:hypothetical protein
VHMTNRKKFNRKSQKSLYFTYVQRSLVGRIATNLGTFRDLTEVINRSTSHDDQ